MTLDPLRHVLGRPAPTPAAVTPGVPTPSPSVPVAAPHASTPATSAPPLVAVADDTLRRVARLFARAGFGATRDEITTWAGRGYTAAVDHLLQLSAADRRAASLDAQLQIGLAGPSNNIAPAQDWWLKRMATTQHPLVEKMALYWHGHFATANNKVESPAMMLRQNQLFRDQAFGDFRVLCKEVTIDPAMLRWLDGQANRRGKPNENYAREFMELFTLGVGRYRQSDVRDAARALTGWTPGSNGAAQLVPAYHDDGLKLILGQGPADFGAEDLTDLVLDHHPEGNVAATHLARRVAAFFHRPDPEPAVVAAMAASVTAPEGRPYPVADMLRTLLLRPEFMDGTGVTIKSPAELVAGVARALNLTGQMSKLRQQMHHMGQDLFNPPNVAGWPGGESWANTSTVIARYNFGLTAAKLVDDNSFDSLLDTQGSNAASVQTWMDRLGILELSAETRAAIDDYVSTAHTNRDSTAAIKRSIITLLIASPDYNLR